MKLGIVDVGGGLRGIYAAGVMDYCMDQKIHFDCCIGVSAGSANMASYLAGQRGRNRLFYSEYAFRKQYMGFGNLLKNGSYINLEYVYGTLSNAGSENPLDYQAMVRNPAELYVVAENAITGETKYFTKADLHQDDYRIFMASCCIPGINRPVMVGGVPYFDGALGDPVPVEKAFSLGCDKVVLILTKPVAIPREVGNDKKLARVIHKHYPVSAAKIARRAQQYNASINVAKEYAKSGLVCIVSPESTDGVTTLSRNKESLTRLYQRGYRDAEQISHWLAEESR